MFYTNNNKKILYIILGIIVLEKIAKYANNETALLSLLLSAPAVLIAITFHEYAHAFVAYKLGDDTAKMQGRLTLNPFAHLDPVGCVLLLFAGFGWGKPVPVNPNNYNRKFDVAKADALVSLAGPLANIIIAFILAIVYCAIFKFAGTGFAFSQIGGIIILLLSVTIATNIGLGIFNLIPLPPLDGSKILRTFLGYNARKWFDENERIFYFIFLAIWITGLAGIIISPIISGVYSGFIKLGALIFGL